MLKVELAAQLRDAGHDVVRASETDQARADDALILKRAVEDRRTLVTLDSHFGDWAVLPLSEHHGVIRVKVHPTTTEKIAIVLIPLLANHVQTDFQNRLVIASASRLRWIQTMD